jgi:acetolactate synthase-1/2/3 large subunit
MKIKISDLIANFLAEKGCEQVFTVTGGGAMHLNDSFGHNEKLVCMYNHHEQACAIAAEGYTRQSGKPAILCVTSGPGGTNALTGVMGSWLDSIPVFVVSGQVKFETTIKSVPDLDLRQLGDQEFNIVDCVPSMTKYVKMIDDASTILYHLEKAWYLMTNRRPGPVWIDVPLNIQASIVETDNLIHFSIDELKDEPLDNFDLKDSNDLLNQIKLAKRPVLFAGTAIDNTGYGQKFIKFAERLNIPVVTAWNANDVIYDEHFLACGRPGTVGTRGGNFVVQNSDLLLVIGSQLNIRQISYNWKCFAQDAKLIVVDFDKNELKKPTLSIDQPIYTDLRNFIDVCLNNKDFVLDNHREWLAYAKQLNNKFPANKGNYPIKKEVVNPYEFMDMFSQNVPEGDTIVCGNGSACVVAFQAFNIKKNQRMWTNSGCASMGYGLPAAIGASVAKKGERVLCFEGDGSLQMNIQELMTVRYYNLNLKLVVLNNDGYHSIRQTQCNLFKHHSMCGVGKENGVGFPNMEKIAYAYDIPYYKIMDINSLDNIAKKFLAEENCAILEVMIDKEQFFEPKLSSKVLPDGKIISPSIEDMFPFLDRDVYNNCMIKDKE